MFPSLDQAIGQFEGFGTPGTIATRQNNPGNLIYGPFAQNMGATGAGTNNIAIFPNSSTGFSAMDQLIQQYAGKGYNIQQLIGAWAPPNAPGNSPQSTQNYTNFVAQQAGATPQTPLSGLAQGQSILSNAGKLLKGIAGGIAGSTGGGTGAINAGMAGGISGATGAQVEPKGQSSFSFSRLAAIVVGLIAIAGSIYLFKSGDIDTIVTRALPIAA